MATEISKEKRSAQRKSKFLTDWKASGLCNEKTSFNWEVKNVTTAQKTWLGEKLTSNAIQVKELADIVEVNIISTDRTVSVGCQCIIQMETADEARPNTSRGVRQTFSN